MLLSLFWTFFQIGLFTFGGGYAMIANIREVVVDKKHWLDDDELVQVITIAESTPGPIAINLATYVGFKKQGFLGSLCATLGVILPSLIIIYAISLFLEPFMANKYVRYAFVGIQCAVAFLILKAGMNMLQKMQKKILSLILFGGVFALMLICKLLNFGLSSIVLILLGGAIGIFAYTLPGLRKEAEK